MAIQYYMNYVIYFSNDAEYQQALAQSNGTGLLLMTPRAAATQFGIPFPYPTGPIVGIPKGVIFIPPFIPGTHFFFPNDSGVTIDDTVLNITISAQTGNPATIWPVNHSNDGIFTWSGNIILNHGAGASLAPPVTNIPQRRWIMGRELSNGLEPTIATSPTPASFCRDCSRTIDGIGYMIRAGINTANFAQLTNMFRSPTNPRTSWERFYFRLRRLPTLGNFGVWRTMGTGGTAIGIGIYVTPSGQLRACDSLGVDKGLLLQATSGGPNPQFEFNKWFRLDAFLRYNDSPISSFGRIFLNGVDFGFFTSIGGFSTTHGQSIMGRWLDPGTDNTFEMDIDDWMNAELPDNVDQNSLNFTSSNFTIDFQLGTHIRAVNVLSASQVNWAPAGIAVGVENQSLPVLNRVPTSVITSSTASAQLEGVTDAPAQGAPDSYSTIIGAASALVSLQNINAGGTDGTLGYRLAGGAPVLASINQLNTEGGNIVGYFPSGVVLPAEIAPFSLVHVKSADANLDTSISMGAVVEYIGVFGVEDDPTWTFPDIRINFTHNNRFANSQWGYVGSQPIAPVYAIGGTYIGNGTYQEITIPAPLHFLHIRPLTGVPLGGLKWTAGMLNARVGNGVVIPNFRTWFDSTSGLFKFSVTGTSVDFNANGVTFQYIAFCDPGMRYNLCGAYSHFTTGVNTRPNNLVVANFLTDLGIFAPDSVDGSGSSGLFYKGPGFTGNTGEDLSGNTNANIGNFAVGIFNSGTTINSPGGAMNNSYSLWRMLDSGAGGCVNNVMIQALQYTGNGAGGNRVISLTPVSGRFPLFVLVIPNAAAASFFRDPSHTANNSASFIALANSTTAITATGIDTISVGVTLNANGVVYSVFIICGDTAGMNNGTYFPSYCQGSGPYIPPQLFNGVTVLGNGGLSLDGSTPLGMLRDISGIYTLIPGKRNDTLMDRQTGQTSVDVEIPDPTFKTGYVGG
jgi:hypothetical protein